MTSSLDELVQDMIVQGRTFEEVEAVIQAAGVSEMAKSTAWLLAWAELPREKRRGVLAGIIAVTPTVAPI